MRVFGGHRRQRVSGGDEHGGGVRVRGGNGLGAQLEDHGTLYLASLIRGSARSNAYLKLLKSHGDIAEIRTPGELYELALDAGIGTVSVTHEGAMAYLVISR